jgi:hypothetical protein
MGPNGVQGPGSTGRCGVHVGKPSYGDLERALILGNKRGLNIKFPKENALAMMAAAMTRNVEPKLGAGIKGGTLK